jgi:predicted TIM-barrel fold metal-dependent hydrolase
VIAGEISYTETRPSGWTADLRLHDMDEDGIDLSVLYPTNMLGLQGLKDVDFGRVQARAYNDWCASHIAEGNGRLFGAGALPPGVPTAARTWATSRRKARTSPKRTSG